jgi:hypothetical protein
MRSNRTVKARTAASEVARISHARQQVAEAEIQVTRILHLLKQLNASGSPTQDAEARLAESNMKLLQYRNHFDIISMLSS